MEREQKNDALWYVIIAIAGVVALCVCLVVALAILTLFGPLIGELFNPGTLQNAVPRLIFSA